MEPKPAGWIRINPPTLRAWEAELRGLNDAQLLVRLRLTFAALKSDPDGWNEHRTALENEVQTRNSTRF